MDTGSDITIVDVEALVPEIEIDPNESVLITGITSSQVETLGSAFVRILNALVKIQVVNYDLPVPFAAGVLGIDYLNEEEVEISFRHKTIVTSSNPIKPIPFLSIPISQSKIPEIKNKTSVFRIKARTRQVISIKVTNPDLKEGYLSPLNVSKDVLLGNAAVPVENGTCFVMAINTLVFPSWR